MSFDAHASVPRLRANVADLEKSRPVWQPPPRVDRLSPAEQVKQVSALSLRGGGGGEEGEGMAGAYAWVRFNGQLAGQARGRLVEVLAGTVADAKDNLHEWNRADFKLLVYFLAYVIVANEKEDREATVQATAAKGAAKRKKATSADKAKDATEAAPPAAAATEDSDDDDDDNAPRTASGNNKSAAAKFDWSSYREKALRALLSSLVSFTATSAASAATTDRTAQWVDLGHVFPTGLPDEDFLSLYTQVGEFFLENGTVIRSGSATRAVVLDLLAAPSHRFHETVGHSVASSLAHLVREQEHAGVLVSELLLLLQSNTYNQDERLARELILEVGNSLIEGESGATSAKNVAGFVEDVASRLPGLLLSNLSVLLPHLNGEAYQMRCAIIRSMAFLVEHLMRAGTVGSPMGTDKTRDKLLDVLAERIHDVSSWGRGAALQAWIQITEAGALPLTHVHLATDLACERLGDKSAVVRKAALQLLRCVVERNPYGADLSTDVFLSKVTETQQWMVGTGYDKDGDVEVASEAGEEQEVAATKGTRRHRPRGGNPVSEDEEEEPEPEPEPELLGDDTPDDADQPPPTPQELELKAKLEFLKYCKSALVFITKIESACAPLCNLLTSKTTTDVLGALRFFASAHEFHLHEAQTGIRKMLRLIWDTRDSGAVRKELIEVFERLYVARTTVEGERSTTPKRYAFPPEVVALNLIHLAEGANVDELVSMEQVVMETMRGADTGAVLKRRVLPSTAIDALWNLAESTSATSPTQARAALCVLSMCAASQPSVVDRIPGITNLIRVGLGTSVEDRDLVKARYAFAALCKAARARGDLMGLDTIERTRLESLAFEVVACPSPQSSAEDWFPAAETALDALVFLSERPEERFEQCVQRLSQSAGANPEALSRLFFVAGHVALKLLVMAEALVSKIKKTRGAPALPAAAVATTTKQAAADAADTDLLGATADEDMEDLLLKRISDGELLGPGTFLGQLIPLVAQVACSPESALPSSNPAGMLLRRSAVLTLCKFMCVSEAVCEKHLPLLFTILRDAQEPQVRANIVIAVGDLAFRFPNSVEPYTSHVYQPLRDPVVSVRKNALMVLTHLVLNDMVKVRGEVVEIALCLQDEDERIQDLARFFFTELSKRGSNPIYNLLPDVLGTLSRENKVSEVAFRDIARYLLEFVDKDRQCEAIADKLCHRIHAASGFPGEGDAVVPSQLGEIRQCRDLAFCLEVIKTSDSLGKRMSEDLFKTFRPLLGDGAIYTSLSRMAAKIKTAAKSAEAKRIAEDLVSKLDSVHKALAEDVAVADKAAAKSARAGGVKKRAGGTSALAVAGENAPPQPLQQQQPPQTQAKAGKKKAPVSRPRKATAGARSKREVSSEGEESSQGEEENSRSVPPPAKKVAVTRRGPMRPRKAVEAAEHDVDDDGDDE